MEKAEAEMDRVQKPLEEIDEQCPECGRKLVIRTGRYGRFISCSGFPECRYGRSFVNKTGALCPVCHADLVERKTRQKKRLFYGCNNFPTCNFAIWERPVPDLCPQCGGLMVVPKPGQDPVCYQEVIAAQRNAEEKPQQNGQERTRRTARKRVASAEDTPEVSADAAVKTVRRSSSATKKKTVATEGAPEIVAVKGDAKSATGSKKTSPSTTPSTTRKQTTTRGKAASASSTRTSATGSATGAKKGTIPGKAPTRSGRTKAAK
jgi:DNA topoisomerase-1